MINLYIEQSLRSLDVLRDEDWDLHTQLGKLETWVLENHRSLTEGPYVADIGFTASDQASGGGATLSYETMKIMAEIKLSIYLSEYQEWKEG